MAVLSELSSYLVNSIYTPLLQADPCYVSIIEQAPNILTQLAKDTGYSVASIPESQEGYLILLAKEEIYWRLATAQAPNYDLETEFTKIIKSKRFDHYFKLISLLKQKIDEYQVSVQVSDVVLNSREGSARNYALAVNQDLVQVTPSGITSTSVNLDWIPYDVNLGMFSCYDILVGRNILYDPYSDPVINFGQEERRIMLTDIKRVKYRVNDLVPNSLYNVVIIYKSASKHEYAIAQFTTLP